jgi:hypothetical protein
MLLATSALTGALWARSVSSGDVLSFFAGTEGKLQAIGSSDGALCLLLTNIPFGHERSWTAYFISSDNEQEGPEVMLVALSTSLLTVRPSTPSWLSTVGTPPGYGVLGFSLGKSQRGVVMEIDDSRIVYITLPHWLAVAVFGLTGLSMLVSPSARRARRRSAGLCEQCGYDLRASLERCPECGAMIDRARAA